LIKPLRRESDFQDGVAFFLDGDMACTPTAVRSELLAMMNDD
jgi:hypothetical protein